MSPTLSLECVHNEGANINTFVPNHPFVRENTARIIKQTASPKTSGIDRGIMVPDGSLITTLHNKNRMINTARPRIAESRIRSDLMLNNVSPGSDLPMRSKILKTKGGLKIQI